MNAIHGFVYAVEAEDWAFAYRCLTPRSRENFSETKMYFAILLYEDPETGVGLHDLITRSELNRSFLDYSCENAGATSASLMLQYDYVNERGIEDTILLDVFLERSSRRDELDGEVDRWEIDLLRTAAPLAPRA